MNNDFDRGEGQFTLEDQAFLKSLGISGMPRGLEAALEHQKQAKTRMSRIEARAETLQPLDLDDNAIRDLARERGQSRSRVERDLRFFRDLNQDPDQEPEKLP